MSTGMAKCGIAEIGSTTCESRDGCNRLSRNMSDKLRRDKLNNYISQLADLVAPPTPNIKRREKTAILKLSVNYLRLHHDLAPFCKRKKWKGPFTMADNLGVALLESVGGFLLIVSRRGTLMFASDTIESLLGHIPDEIIGQSVFNVLHPDDHGILKSKLSLFDEHSQSGNSQEETERYVSFYIRIANLRHKVTDSPLYEMVHVVGQVKKYFATNGEDGTNQLEPELSLIGVGRLHRHLEIQDIIAAPPDNEYVTRHDLMGNINFAHPNASVVLGYMPAEVCGMSAYKFLHRDDLPIMANMHKRVLEEGSMIGQVARLTSVTGKTVFVRTHGFTCYNKWTKKAQHIISVHQVMSEEEGARFIMESRPKQCNQNSSNVVSTNENPTDIKPDTVSPEQSTMSESFSRTLSIIAGQFKYASQRKYIESLLCKSVSTSIKDRTPNSGTDDTHQDDVLNRTLSPSNPSDADPCGRGQTDTVADKVKHSVCSNMCTKDFNPVDSDMCPTSICVQTDSSKELMKENVEVIEIKDTEKCDGPSGCMSDKDTIEDTPEEFVIFPTTEEDKSETVENSSDSIDESHKDSDTNEALGGDCGVSGSVGKCQIVSPSDTMQTAFKNDRKTGDDILESGAKRTTDRHWVCGKRKRENSVEARQKKSKCNYEPGTETDDTFTSSSDGDREKTGEGVTVNRQEESLGKTGQDQFTTDNDVAGKDDSGSTYLEHEDKWQLLSQETSQHCQKDKSAVIDLDKKTPVSQPSEISEGEIVTVIASESEIVEEIPSEDQSNGKAVKDNLVKQDLFPLCAKVDEAEIKAEEVISIQFPASRNSDDSASPLASSSERPPSSRSTTSRFINNPEIIRLHQSSLMSLLEESERDLAKIGNFGTLEITKQTDNSNSDNEKRLTDHAPVNDGSRSESNMISQQSSPNMLSSSCTVSWSMPTTACRVSVATSSTKSPYVVSSGRATARRMSASSSRKATSQMSPRQLQEKQKKLQAAMHAQMKEITSTQEVMSKHHLQNSYLSDLVKLQGATIKGQQMQLGIMQEHLLQQTKGSDLLSALINSPVSPGNTTMSAIIQGSNHPNQSLLSSPVQTCLASPSSPPCTSALVHPCTTMADVNKDKSLAESFPQLTSYLLSPGGGHKLAGQIPHRMPDLEAPPPLAPIACTCSVNDDIPESPRFVQPPAQSPPLENQASHRAQLHHFNGLGSVSEMSLSRSEAVSGTGKSVHPKEKKHNRVDFTRYSDQTRAEFLEELQERPVSESVQETGKQHHSLVRSLIVSSDPQSLVNLNGTLPPPPPPARHPHGNMSFQQNDITSCSEIQEQKVNGANNMVQSDQILSMLMDVDIDKMIADIGACAEGDGMDIDFAEGTLLDDWGRSF